MPQSTACVFCGKPTKRKGSVGSFPKYCGKACEYKARYQRNRAAQLAIRPAISCACCGVLMPGARPDRKFCSSACQSYTNRRDRGEVVENAGKCAACLKPLVGRQSNARMCASRKCQIWALRHPGIPHPSTQYRVCAWCGVSIDHRNGKAKYCGQPCITAAWIDRNRKEFNASRRADWVDPASPRKKSQQAYRKANADKYRQYCRDSRSKDPERYRAYYTKWLADPANYQIVSQNKHKRRARKRQNSDSVGVNVRDWMKLVRRHCSCCAYCGKYVERPVIEHVIPLARGGRHAIGNVLSACAECNASKHASFIMEWRKRRPQIAGSFSLPPLVAPTLCRG